MLLNCSRSTYICTCSSRILVGGEYTGSTTCRMQSPRARTQLYQAVVYCSSFEVYLYYIVHCPWHLATRLRVGLVCSDSVLQFELTLGCTGALNEVNSHCSSLARINRVLPTGGCDLPPGGWGSSRAILPTRGSPSSRRKDLPPAGRMRILPPGGWGSSRAILPLGGSPSSQREATSSRWHSPPGGRILASRRDEVLPPGGCHST